MRLLLLLAVIAAASASCSGSGTERLLGPTLNSRPTRDDDTPPPMAGEWTGTVTAGFEVFSRARCTGELSVKIHIRNVTELGFFEAQGSDFRVISRRITKAQEPPGTEGLCSYFFDTWHAHDFEGRAFLGTSSVSMTFSYASVHTIGSYTERAIHGTGDAGWYFDRSNSSRLAASLSLERQP